MMIAPVIPVGTIDDQIIALRISGFSCRAVAEQLSIEEYQVWNCMRKYGYAGKFRAKSMPVLRMQIDLDYALDQANEVIIERGLNGGYVVTVGDLTGKECMSLNAAIRSAIE